MLGCFSCFSKLLYSFKPTFLVTWPKEEEFNVLLTSFVMDITSFSTIIILSFETILLERNCPSVFQNNLLLLIFHSSTRFKNSCTWLKYVRLSYRYVRVIAFMLTCSCMRFSFLSRLRFPGLFWAKYYRRLSCKKAFWYGAFFVIKNWRHPTFWQN